MKNILYSIVVLLLSGCSNKFLEIYPKSTLNEGNFYQSEVEYILLANGMTILVVENHKLPKVSATLSIDMGPVLEGKKAGVMDLMGSMLGEGTKSIYFTEQQASASD